jgi:hypothetical protein
MSQYEKECNRCGQKIKMSDESGKWKAFDLDGKNIHECKSQETKGHDYVMKQVRLGSISEDLAEKITETLDNNQILIYKRIGPRLLDVYAEVQVWKK